MHAGGTVVGWTLDFMRRRCGTHGVMEFLIASAAQTFRDEGARFASLSGAPLAQPGSREVEGLQRVLDLVALGRA